MFYVSKNDVEYLRPPPEAEHIQHSADYIKSGWEHSSKRNIFYGSDLDSFEQKQVDILKREIDYAGITLNKTWIDRELLKYLYAARFDTKKALENITECLKWRAEIQSLSVTNPALELLYAGAVYTVGRDHLMRPIVIINFDKIDIKNATKNDLGMVITFFLDSVKEFSLLQGKIENIILIIDGANKDFDPVSSEKFETLLKKMAICHPTIVEKAYVLNSSYSLNSLWNQTQKFFEKETISKVQFISKDEYSKLQDDISSNQLEIKYGGSMSNLTSYWPLCLIRVTSNPSQASLIEGRPSAKSFSINSATQSPEKRVSSIPQDISFTPIKAESYEAYTSTPAKTYTASPNLDTYASPISYAYETPSTYDKYTPQYETYSTYTLSYEPKSQPQEHYVSSAAPFDLSEFKQYKGFEQFASGSPNYGTYTSSLNVQPVTYERDYSYQYNTTPVYENYVSSSLPQDNWSSPLYEKAYTFEYDYNRNYQNEAPVSSAVPQEDQKPVAKEEPTNQGEEQEEEYDFNHDDLVNLINNEHELLKTGQATFKTPERESLYKLKELTPEEQNDNTTPRETFYTDYSGFRRERETLRSALLNPESQSPDSVFRSSTFKTRVQSEYDSEPTTANVSPVEKPKKSLFKPKKQEEEEELEQEEMGSWGMCVSSRKKQQQAV